MKRLSILTVISLLFSASIVLFAPAQGQETSSWQKYLLQACPVAHLLLQQQQTGTGANSQDVCKTCIFAVQKLVPIFMPTSKAGKYAADAIFEVAPVFVGKYCAAILTTYKDEILTAILPMALKAPDQFCALLLQQPSCAANPTAPMEPAWTIELPAPLKKPPPKPQKSAEQVRILHLTDIHLDLDYKVGAPSNCLGVMCCQNDSVPIPGQTPKPAGKYGAYKTCDLSPALFDGLLRAIVDKHGEKIDVVYVTGDYPAHDIEKYTRERHLRTIETVTRSLKATFGNVTVFMVVGNHEAVPTDSFPPDLPNLQTAGHSNEWLYSRLADLWVTETGWLPNDTYADIYSGGFYTALLKPGWRVIAINDNYCNVGNFWLYMSSKDPFGQLDWLVKWLTFSELNNERVHLLAHLPTGDDNACRKVWSANYYQIISRFRDTISAQFFGHVHTGYFTVYYDAATLKEPVSVAYSAPSVTPYYLETANGVNPAYYIFTADSQTMEVVRLKQYYVDLGKANADGQVAIQKAVSIDAVFQLQDYTPQSMHNLALSFQTNDRLFQEFYRLSYSNNIRANCPDRSACKRKTLCMLHSGRSYDPELCKRWVPEKL